MFEVNIRFIGGLLAAYYLSGQEVSALKWQSHAEKASLNEKKDFHPFFCSCLLPFTPVGRFRVVSSRETPYQVICLCLAFTLLLSVLFTLLLVLSRAVSPPGLKASRRGLH